MNIEKMRSLLATRCMEWTVGRDSHNNQWWVTHGTYKDREGRIWRTVSAKWWRPDTDWQQCGMVIEKMHEMGWIPQFADTGGHGIYRSLSVLWFKFGEPYPARPTRIDSVKYLPRGICWAAARALEPEAADE